MPTRPLLLVLAMLGEPTSISNEEIGRLYGEGQEKFEQKDYAAAADRFEELFDRIPESPNNRAIRESLALNILDACILGFEDSREPAFLERGREFIRRYYAEFVPVYGESVAVIAELQSVATRISELEQDIRDAETLGPCLDPCLSACLAPPPPCLQSIEPRRGCGGGGDPGLAAALLLPLGLRRRRDVLERLADRLPADVIERLRAKADEG